LILAEEDLARETDENMLLDISDLDSISSNDLKLAIGEEVAKVEEEIIESETLQELESDTEITSDNSVEALKKLLIALSNEDVVASMKGMKININITLGG
jgi:uncharacterized membrane protein